MVIKCQKCQNPKRQWRIIERQFEYAELSGSGLQSKHLSIYKVLYIKVADDTYWLQSNDFYLVFTLYLLYRYFTAKFDGSHQKPNFLDSQFLNEGRICLRKNIQIILRFVNGGTMAIRVINCGEPKDEHVQTHSYNIKKSFFLLFFR